MTAATPSSVRARRRLSVDARRGAILDAASILFAQRGSAAVSVEEVAAAAGASPALVHHYFGTRQQLVDETLRRIADDLLRLLRVDSRAPAAEQLQVGLTIYLDYVAGHAHSWTALLRAGRPGTDAAATIAAEVDDHASRLAIRAVHPGRRRPPEALAMAVRGWIALVKDSCLRWLEEASIDRDSLQTLLTHAFVGCIQAATAADPACRPALERLSQPATAQ